MSSSPSPPLRPHHPPGLTLGELSALLSTPLSTPSLGAHTPLSNDAATVLTGVTLDSRAVQPGDLYAALPGSRAHGAEFCEAARSAGAVAVLTDAAGAERAAGLPSLIVDDPRGQLGRVAAAIYGEPATQVRTVGVTGTNGKTTVSYLAEAALRATGLRTGLIGTIEARLLTPEGPRRLPSARTTPEAPDLQALLAVMVEAGTDAVAMEVSSHALVLGRVDGLVVDVAVFTNLSQDHLDFHHDMESYFAAKASLFTPERSRRGVVCIDDDWGRRLARQSSVPVVTVATGGSGAASSADVVVEPTGPSRATVRWRERTDGAPSREVSIELQLPGRFNLANAALALATADLLGLDLDLAAAGVSQAVVPGRMERVDRGQPFLAVVDFAHTPEAVRTALETLREQVDGQVITVLGCGGDRDAAKRPVMGELAAAASDILVVTNPNPRPEHPEAIRRAGLAGAGRVAGARVEDVARRADAIRRAVALARAGDVVAVLGKGHEQGQEIAGVVHPFDDRVELGLALEELVEARPSSTSSTPEEAL
ncbi:MAG: UDP-N-acetylmuramoyl-L-alanyl-D-glutamate--2,6-diaminopimelate ligase [Actinomycetales bacterium]